MGDVPAFDVGVYVVEHVGIEVRTEDVWPLANAEYEGVTVGIGSPYVTDGDDAVIVTSFWEMTTF